MAANDIYRSYQVVVAETIRPAKNGGTGGGRFSSEITGALHTTNRLYQDALCYYILRLASLSPERNPLWRHLQSVGMIPQTQVVIQRLAGRYDKFAGISSTRDFLERVTSASISEDQLAATYEILEQQGIVAGEEGEGGSCADMSTFAGSWASILCHAEGGTTIPGNGIYDRLHRQLRGASDEVIERELLVALDAAEAAETAKWSLALDAEIADALVAKKPKQTEAAVEGRVQKAFAKRGSDRRERTRAAFLKAFESPKTGKYRTLSAEHCAAAIEEIQAAAADDPRFKRLRYGERDNSFDQPLFRFLWLREDPAGRKTTLDDLRDYLEKESPEPAPTLRGSAVTKMPYQPGARILLPFFSNCLGLRGREAWDFEKAAFAEAAEDVFKYKLRTEKREKDRTEASERLRLFEGDGEFVDEKLRDGSVRRTYRVRGMRNDPRRELMEELLSELGEGLGGYALRPATIGGWADLRKSFLRKERANSDDLANALVDLVEKAQADSAGGFGSAAFFLKLCEEQHYPLWQGEWSPREEFHADDFVRHFVRYSELRREAQELEGPIRFTWPGEKNRFRKTSWRHLDFTALLGPQINPLLFVESPPEGGGKWPLYSLTDQLALSLSGRRMKRDRLVNAQGESIESKWSPPLVPVDDPPLITAKKKKEAKPTEVSFSLIVREANDAENRPDAVAPPVYLNVAVQVTGAELAKIQGRPLKWEKSIRRNRDGSGRYFRWPVDVRAEGAKVLEKSGDAAAAKKSAGPLWCGDGAKSLRALNVVAPDNLHVLAIDLGVRVGAAFAVLEVGIGGEKGRRISPDGWPDDIRAIRRRVGELKLPGEGAKVWTKETGFSPEEFGRRGRFPNPDEITDFLRFAEDLYPAASFDIPDPKALTFPELSDHLLYRFKRRLGRIRRLFHLRWQLRGTMERNPDSDDLRFTLSRDKEKHTPAHHRAVAEFLGRKFAAKEQTSTVVEEGWMRGLREKLATNKEWEAAKGLLKRHKKEAEESERRAQLDAMIASWAWKELGTVVSEEFDHAFDAIGAAAEHVALRCLPLREKTWSWEKMPPPPGEPKDCWRLMMQEDAGKKLPIRGMRGLSIARVEQIQDLRRALQSLAKLFKNRNNTGFNPPPSGRGEEVHDACPEVLEKINELRDQRVNQTAHMILAEALGKRLSDPSKVQIDGKAKSELKSERDLHGVYEPILQKDGSPAPRCTVIAVENLTRYRTSQDRGRFENRRLMEWSHRNVIKKLQDIAKPFRIEIVLVDATYSSRFDSRTGSPGIRVECVTAGFEEKPPFVRWIAEKSRAKKTEGKPSARAQFLQEVKKQFADGYEGELLVPVEGGPWFLSAASGEKGECRQNADINAATNIGLRALAHPDRLDIFPLVKTDALSEGRLRIRNARGGFAELPQDSPAREVVQDAADDEAVESHAVDAEEADELESGARPNLFVDVQGRDLLPVGETFAIRLPNSEAVWKSAKSAVFWRRVRDLATARITQINNVRLQRHHDAGDEIPM